MKNLLSVLVILLVSHVGFAGTTTNYNVDKDLPEAKCKKEAFKAMTGYHLLVPRTESIMQAALVRKFTNGKATYTQFDNTEELMFLSLRRGNIKSWVWSKN